MVLVKKLLIMIIELLTYCSCFNSTRYRPSFVSKWSMSAVHLPLPKMAGRSACSCFISSVKAGASSRNTNVSEFSFTSDQSKSHTTRTLPSPLSAASDAPAQRESHIVVSQH